MDPVNTEASETISQQPPKTRILRVTLIRKVLNSPRDKYNKVVEAIRDIKQSWRGYIKCKDYTIKELEDGILRFSFKYSYDKEWAMGMRPWVLGCQGYLLMLQEWCPYVPLSLDLDIFHTSPFWIQAHGIPPKLMYLELVFDIGRVVFGAEAVRVEVDRDDNDNAILRIKAMVNVKKRLVGGCWLCLPKNEDGVDDKFLWVPFKYEKLFYKCFSCGSICHSSFSCWNDSLISTNVNKKLDYGDIIVSYNGGENEKPMVSVWQIFIDMRKMGNGSWLQNQFQWGEGESYPDLDDCKPNSKDGRQREGRIVSGKDGMDSRVYGVIYENLISVVLQPKPQI